MIWSVSLVAFAALVNSTLATRCGPELQSPDQIESMPTFDEGVDSYLSRNMNQEVWDQLADRFD